MKLLIVPTLFVLLLACSINNPICYTPNNGSNFDNNFPILDSIYVDSEYLPVGKVQVRFSSMFGNYPFPIELYPIDYPKLAIMNEIEGSVILQVEISANGLVEQFLVKKSLMPGPCGLDEAAINSAMNSKYSPAYYNGKPVACWYTYSINFSLDK